MPGSGRHEVFAARGLVSHPLTPSDYVRVTRVLAAAPLPRRDDLDPPHPKIRLTGATSTPSTHGIQACLCSTSCHTPRSPPHARRRQGPPLSASRSRASARRTSPLRLEDETAFSAILRKPMNWLGICRNNAASSIGLSGRPVWFSATMPVRNPSLAAARSNSCVRTAACNYLNRMAQSSCLSFLMLPCARSSAR